MKKKYWEFKNLSDETAELYIYSEIGEDVWGESLSATDFKEELDNLGSVSNLNIYINSPGGSVFDGLAIHNMLKRHKAYKKVFVDGLAASIASVIALAGDEVIIPENAFFMIHMPMSGVYGNAKEFREMADTLDKISEGIVNIYEEKTEMPREELIAKMEAETWMTGADAKGFGFATEVVEEKKIAACFDMKNYKNIPDFLMKQDIEPVEDMSEVYKNKIKFNNRRLEL
jgi:ATP-dependent Clp protease protease subunit